MGKFKIYILIVWLVLVLVKLEAQEEPVKDLPVRELFAGSMVIDNQTTVVPTLHTLEFLIQHKFGAMDNGFSDLFGIMAPGANIRLGLNFVPLKNLQVGYGLSRIRMSNDFSIKYTILEQTRENAIPIAVGLYSNATLDGRDKDELGTQFEFTNRFSYFTQLIIGRKVTSRFSVQANGSFLHYNLMEKGIDHDKFDVGINGRFLVTAQGSIIFQYNHPLLIDGISEHREFINPAQPNLGLGWEIRTSSHVFHLYVSSTDGLLPQYSNLYNQYDFTKGEFMFGFTITRLYNL